MRALRVCSLIAVVLLASPAFAEKAYTQADLNALAKDHGWEELLQHAKDVAPSDRDDAWKKLVEEAAVGHLAEVKDADFKWTTTESVQSALDGMATSFPHLKTSKAFQHQGNLTMVRALKACMFETYCKGSDPDFLRKVYLFSESHKSDPDAACAAGEMLMTRMVAYTALHSFQFATEGGNSSACCRKPEVQKAVDSGIGEKSYAESAKKVAASCGLTPAAPKVKKK